MQSGTRRLKMQSWHERYERNGKVVALSTGLTPLNGRKLEDALKADTAEYRHFRDQWTKLRKRIAALIPKEGKPTSGTFELKLLVVR
jgi:hypothetical protein